MSKFCRLGLLLAVIFLPTNFLKAEVREWTRAADGKKISAEFAGMKDENTVKIKMANDQVFEVPLQSLSEADREFVKAQRKEGDAKEMPEKASTEKAEVPEGSVKVTLSGVHLCCKDCTDAVEALKEDKESGLVEEGSISANRGDRTVVIEAASGADAMRAVQALFKLGFYGTSDNPAIAMPEGKDSEFTADTMSIRDVHLCCKGCVRDFNEAVESVEGVEESNAEGGASSVIVKGDGFNPYTVMKALRAAGFGGTFR